MPLKFLMQKHNLFLRRETVLGIKAVKLHGQKKQLNCCGLKCVKERMKWEGTIQGCLSVKFEIYYCKRKANRLWKPFHSCGNTCKRRSVFRKVVIWKLF